jgi:AmiR/NasT family two-component response regulator
LARKVVSTIDERDTIEEAKGMISQRFSVTADVALIRIRKASAKSNSPIMEVARAIVTRNNEHPSISHLDEN